MNECCDDSAQLRIATLEDELEQATEVHLGDVLCYGQQIKDLQLEMEAAAEVAFKAHMDVLNRAEKAERRIAELEAVLADLREAALDVSGYLHKSWDRGDDERLDTLDDAIDATLAVVAFSPPAKSYIKDCPCEDGQEGEE